MNKLGDKGRKEIKQNKEEKKTIKQQKKQLARRNLTD